MWTFCAEEICVSEYLYIKTYFEINSFLYVK